MNIAFRVDASLNIGTGHVMRCLSLADKLVESGAEVAFYTRPQQDSLDGIIKERHHEVYSLPPSLTETSAESCGNDYRTWLTVSQEQDCQDFVETVQNKQMKVDLVIVDHYGIDASWEKETRRALGCKILVIDDLTRLHDADWIIDQTLGRKTAEYQGSKFSVALMGTEYALLKPKFSELRQAGLQAKSITDGLTVLITMGGMDKSNATFLVLRCLLRAKYSFEIKQIHVVLNEKSPSFVSVQELCQQYSAKVTIHTFVTDMTTLMIQANLAIGAPGSTSWERCCLGLPSILIPIADNQKFVAKSLYEHKAVELLSLNDIDTMLVEKVNHLLDNYSDYQVNSFNVCDGLGVPRVIQHLFPKTDRNDNPITIRLATEQDIEFVYSLQLIPETRKYALTRNIPSWEVHNAWMKARLVSKDCYFYIIQQAYTDVGVLRLDRKENTEYEISIFLHPDVYRLGVAKTAIQIMTEIHSNITLFATVLEENRASQVLFTSLGFKKLGSTSYKLKRH